MDQSKLLAFLLATASHQESLIKMKGVMSALSGSESTSSNPNHANNNKDGYYSIQIL